MKIPVLRAYENPYANGVDAASSNSKMSTSKIDAKAKENINKSIDKKDSNELLTNRERQFFMNLFPESSDQIEKHVLFNRNGKLQSPDISKGAIFDGRA